MLTIDRKEAGTVTVLTVKGRLMSGPAANSLGKEISQALADQKQNLVVDLSGVTFLDSSGIGELVAAYTAAKKQGGAMKLVVPAGNVGEVLRMTRILTMIENYPDCENAVASFSN